MATINAASPSRDDVAAAVAAASDLDTIVIPSGTAEWSSAVDVSKAVYIRGAGVGSTILQDNIPTSGGWDDRCFFNVSLVANLTTRITDIEFNTGTRATTDSSGGAIFVSGSNADNRRIAIGRCKFHNLRRRASIFSNGAIGVAYECEINISSNLFAFDIRHGNWGGQSYGDGSWTDDPHYGTDKFFFIEDCTITHSSIYDTIDTYSGARWVFRYSTINVGRFATHGTESTGRERGTRALEIYRNNVSGNGVSSPVLSHRSGSAVLHHNTLTAVNLASGKPFSGQAFRIRASFAPWGVASGENAWDENDAGSPFATGTATSGGTLTMTDSGASWTTNQWARYSLVNVNTGKASYIVSNTETTITFATDGYSSSMTFSGGETYRINKVITVLDQPGVGTGDLIDIDTPAWPNEVVEPVYSWDNTVNGSPMAETYAAGVPMVDGVHYFNEALPGYTEYTYPHPLRGLPAVPADLAATQDGATAISLSWTDASSDEDGFTIERSLNGSTGWTEIADLPADSTAYVDTGLSSGTTYYYRVAAYNEYGSSAWSDVASAATEAAPVIASGESMSAPGAYAWM